MSLLAPRRRIERAAQVVPLFAPGLRERRLTLDLAGLWARLATVQNDLRELEEASR